MYGFRTLSDPSLTSGTSKLTLPPSAKKTEYIKRGTSGIYNAAFRGALLQLFGEPYRSSPAAEDAFKYIIEASDQQGNRWILRVYSGPSGPAIGGNADDPSIYPVAAALLQLIDSTAPADFEAIIYDNDTDYTV